MHKGHLHGSTPGSSCTFRHVILLTKQVANHSAPLKDVECDIESEGIQVVLHDGSNVLTGLIPSVGHEGKCQWYTVLGADTFLASAGPTRRIKQGGSPLHIPSI